MTTKAQTLANQKNARKSTGPKSIEGKNRSKMNALVHGLRAEEVLIPGEDADAFEAELATWFADFQPQSQARAVLVERAAVAAWRCRRCVKIEAQRLGSLTQQAIRKHDERTRRRINDAAMLVYDDAPAGLDALEGEYEGIERLIYLWSTLEEQATSIESWTEGENGIGAHVHLMTLMGHNIGTEPEEGGEVAVHSWNLFVRAFPEEARPIDTLLDDREAASALKSLQTTIAKVLEHLRHRLTGFEHPDQTRARVALLAAIDDSREGKLLHRYEMSHDRSLRATLATLAQLERSGVDLPEAEPEAELPNEAIEPNSMEEQELEQAPETDDEPVTTNEPIRMPTAAEMEAFLAQEPDQWSRTWEYRAVIASQVPLMAR